MEISGLLTDDVPTRPFGATPTASPQYNSGYAPAPPAHSLNDEPRTVVFYCPTHGRIPLRLELRPSLNSKDIDTMIRTFFAVGYNDEVTYIKEDMRFEHVGYDECLAHSEFHVQVVQGLYYPPQPFPQQLNRHSLPTCNGNGFGSGAPCYKNARSASPNSGRGRRSGSATGGRSRSMKRQNSSNASGDQFDDYVYENGFHYNPHIIQQGQYYHEELRNSRVEPVARAEISLDNIVEGSRRKRAKFSSAELPLFPKPLHPASFSPSRPVMNNGISTPQPQHPSNFQALTPTSVSPYSYNAQSGGSQYGGRQQYGQNFVPNFLTPAPTIATDISDEDAALQLMRLGEASTCSNSPSTLDETADDAGQFSEDHADDGRSDTTELPDLPPIVEEREAMADIRGSPSYSKNTKFKSLDEILPSFATTEPSDNEEEQARKDMIHGNRHKFEDDFDYTEDAADETYKVEDKDDEYDDDYFEDERKGIKCPGIELAKKNSVPKASLNKVNNGRVPKQPAPLQATRQPTILKVKPKPTTALCTAFNQATKTTNIGKLPISPSSPTTFKNSATASSVQSLQHQKSRSTTASSSTLPTPISGFNVVPPSQPMGQHSFLTGLPIGGIHYAHAHSHTNEAEPEKPKPRCQRCRKSKKGCDRQRPCQRCKDAGIGIEGCISEDETNTRRGRAGIAKKAAGMTAGASGVGASGVKKQSKPKKKKV